MKIEEDASVRENTISRFIVPAGSQEFKEGYRECLQMFALHAPNKRQVGMILDDYCINLENLCITKPTRDNYAIYEGYRQAIKDLRKMKKIK